MSTPARWIALFLALNGGCAATVPQTSTGLASIIDASVVFWTDKRGPWLEERHAGEPPESSLFFVRVRVANPDVISQSVVVVCRRVTEPRHEVRQGVNVPARSVERVAMTGFAADVLPYRVRCELDGKPSGPEGSRSVELEIPAIDSQLRAPM